MLLERGRLLNSSKRPDESKAFFLAAWELARSAGADGYAVDAAHMLGIVEPGDSSFAWNRTAMSTRRSRRIPRRAGGSDPSTTISDGPTTESANTKPRWISFERRSRRAKSKGEGGDPCRPLVRGARAAIPGTLRGGAGRPAGAASRGSGRRKPDGYVEEEIGECLLALERARRRLRISPKPIGSSRPTPGSSATRPSGWNGCAGWAGCPSRRRNGRELDSSRDYILGQSHPNAPAVKSP